MKPPPSASCCNSPGSRLLPQALRFGASARRALLAAALALPAAAGADTKELVTTVCGGCHGEDGNSVAEIFPRLAGQHAEYLTKQLNEFMSGKRKSDVMAGVIAGLKSEDVPGLAAHYAAQRPQRGTAQDATLAATGKLVFDDGNTTTGVPACVGCHQPEAAGNERFPRLAGQHREYLLQQMKQFQTGERNNDRAKVMRTIAGRMTEQEIGAVVEYLAGL